MRGGEIPLTPGVAAARDEVAAARAQSTVSRGGAAKPAALPATSPRLVRWFTWYSRRYLKRHFHSLRIARGSVVPRTDGFPLVVYSNHASWFDPLVGLVLKAHCYPEHRLYTPMDATALGRYGFFRKLGFFPVPQNSALGLRQFLRASRAILQSSENVLAITPQSQFVDVRQRPVKFAGGLGMLAANVERALFVPVALEYVFWEERLPEILVRFGTPITIGRGSGRHSPAEWTALFESRLQECQDALALEAQRRDPALFQNILRGDAGPGGVYDLWRAFRSKLRGETFRKEHGRR